MDQLDEALLQFARFGRVHHKSLCLIGDYLLNSIPFPAFTVERADGSIVFHTEHCDIGGLQYGKVDFFPPLNFFSLFQKPHFANAEIDASEADGETIYDQLSKSWYNADLYKATET